MSVWTDCQKKGITDWKHGHFAPTLLCVIHQKHLYSHEFVETRNHTLSVPVSKLHALDQDALAAQLAKAPAAKTPVAAAAVAASS